MKRTVALIVFAAAIMMLALAAGCGGNGGGENTEKTQGQETTAADFGIDQRTVEEELAGTYESSDGLFMTFLEDGSFETGAFGDNTGGTYEVFEGTFGYEVALTFDDGSEDFASVVAVGGEVRGIAILEGIQLIKQ